MLVNATKNVVDFGVVAQSFGEFRQVDAGGLESGAASGGLGSADGVARHLHVDADRAVDFDAYELAIPIAAVAIVAASASSPLTDKVGGVERVDSGGHIVGANAGYKRAVKKGMKQARRAAANGPLGAQTHEGAKRLFRSVGNGGSGCAIEERRRLLSIGR